MSYNPKPGDQLELFPELPTTTKDLLDQDWYVVTTSLQQKKELVQYCLDKGIKVGISVQCEVDNGDTRFPVLSHNSWDAEGEMMLSSYSCPVDGQTIEVTSLQFKQMCAAYAAKNNSK